MRDFEADNWVGSGTLVDRSLEWLSYECLKAL